MTKIKIKSNPYQKETVFQNWDERAAQWVDIDQVRNEDSQLLREAFHTGFFPFQAESIVETILEEYQAGEEKVELVFEGTDDEYRELEKICRQANYENSLSLRKSSRYLENARDILPRVIAVFQTLTPLVAEGVSDEAKRQRALGRFSDASNDIIPICVIGNYSSGKSTFINALIGYELLPSSDEPTTAKIYQISPSEYRDRANIRFSYDDTAVRINFSADEYRIQPDAAHDPLTARLKTLLDSVEGEPLSVKLNRSLEEINCYGNQESQASLSDLIALKVPFHGDSPLREMQSRFLIFDTPGSNSASHQKHTEVLRRAMENLSNGLPIFVSEYNALDSTDNDKLYEDILSIAELDPRFTMLVVNKADGAALKPGGFTEDDRERLLNLALPRKLYTRRLYFVSSILGLGAKNEANFLSDHNAEIFEDQKNKYIDADSRFYKQLYRYNILPTQMKDQYEQFAQQHKNRLYANSGLYSIEQAIETFANTDSHYDKCQQSLWFLDKVIRLTDQEITDEQNRKLARKKQIQNNLEREKNHLIHALEGQSTTTKQTYWMRYIDIMRNHAETVTQRCDPNELEQQKKAHWERQKQEKNITDSREALGKFFDQAKQATIGKQKKRDDPSQPGQAQWAAFADAVKRTPSRFSEWVADQREASETKRGAIEAVSNATFQEVKDAFRVSAEAAQQQLEVRSRAYWNSRSQQLKQLLVETVTTSNALSEETRETLSDIILTYEKPSLDANDDTNLRKEDALRRLGQSNRLDTKKLARNYNEEMTRWVAACLQELENSHKQSFDIWLSSLLERLRENIVAFNPSLHSQAEIIQEEDNRIAALENRRDKLKVYNQQLEDMMDWKEASSATISFG